MERVLFIDADGRTARLAAALLEAMHGDDYEAGCAAVDPTEATPDAADLDLDRPVEATDTVDPDGFKHVVTLDGEAKANCPPVSPGMHYLHWRLPDAEGGIDDLKIAVADRISRSFGKETSHTPVDELPSAWQEEE